MPLLTPHVPSGLIDLMKDLAKEVLRDKPENIFEFAAAHFEKLIQERDGSMDKGYEAFSAFEAYFDGQQRFAVPSNSGYICQRPIIIQPIHQPRKSKSDIMASFQAMESINEEDILAPLPAGETSYADEKYQNAIYVIQRYFRRYVAKKKNLPSNTLSAFTAAIIIQRTMRKLFSNKIKLKKDMDSASSADAPATATTTTTTTTVKLVQDDMDNVSEAASYTSSSTIQMLADGQEGRENRLASGQRLQREVVLDDDGDGDGDGDGVIGAADFVSMEMEFKEPAQDEEEEPQSSTSAVEVEVADDDKEHSHSDSHSVVAATATEMDRKSIADENGNTESTHEEPPNLKSASTTDDTSTAHIGILSTKIGRNSNHQNSPHKNNIVDIDRNRSESTQINTKQPNIIPAGLSVPLNYPQSSSLGATPDTMPATAPHLDKIQETFVVQRLQGNGNGKNNDASSIIHGDGRIRKYDLDNGESLKIYDVYYQDMTDMEFSDSLNESTMEKDSLEPEELDVDSLESNENVVHHMSEIVKRDATQDDGSLYEDKNIGDEEQQADVDDNAHSSQKFLELERVPTYLYGIHPTRTPVVERRSRSRNLEDSQKVPEMKYLGAPSSSEVENRTPEEKSEEESLESKGSTSEESSATQIENNSEQVKKTGGRLKVAPDRDEEELLDLNEINRKTEKRMSDNNLRVQNKENSLKSTEDAAKDNETKVLAPAKIIPPEDVNSNNFVAESENGVKELLSKSETDNPYTEKEVLRTSAKTASANLIDSERRLFPNGILSKTKVASERNEGIDDTSSETVEKVQETNDMLNIGNSSSSVVVKKHTEQHSLNSSLSQKESKKKTKELGEIPAENLINVTSENLQSSDDQAMTQLHREKRSLDMAAHMSDVKEFVFVDKNNGEEVLRTNEESIEKNLPIFHDVASQQDLNLKESNQNKSHEDPHRTQEITGQKESSANINIETSSSDIGFKSPYFSNLKPGTNEDIKKTLLNHDQEIESQLQELQDLSDLQSLSEFQTGSEIENSRSELRVKDLGTEAANMSKFSEQDDNNNSELINDERVLNDINKVRSIENSSIKDHSNETLQNKLRTSETLNELASSQAVKKDEKSADNSLDSPAIAGFSKHTKALETKSTITTGEKEKVPAISQVEDGHESVVITSVSSKIKRLSKETKSTVETKEMQMRKKDVLETDFEEGHVASGDSFGDETGINACGNTQHELKILEERNELSDRKSKDDDKNKEEVKKDVSYSEFLNETKRNDFASENVSPAEVKIVSIPSNEDAEHLGSEEGLQNSNVGRAHANENEKSLDSAERTSGVVSESVYSPVEDHTKTKIKNINSDGKEISTTNRPDFIEEEGEESNDKEEDMAANKSNKEDTILEKSTLDEDHQDKNKKVLDITMRHQISDNDAVGEFKIEEDSKRFLEIKDSSLLDDKDELTNGSNSNLLHASKSDHSSGHEEKVMKIVDKDTTKQLIPTHNEDSLNSGDLISIHTSRTDHSLDKKIPSSPYATKIESKQEVDKTTEDEKWEKSQAPENSKSVELKELPLPFNGGTFSENIRQENVATSSVESQAAEFLSDTKKGTQSSLNNEDSKLQNNESIERTESIVDKTTLKHGVRLPVSEIGTSDPENFASESIKKHVQISRKVFGEEKLPSEIAAEDITIENTPDTEQLIKIQNVAEDTNEESTSFHRNNFENMENFGVKKDIDEKKDENIANENPVDVSNESKTFKKQQEFVKNTPPIKVMKEMNSDGSSAETSADFSSIGKDLEFFEDTIKYLKNATEHLGEMDDVFDEKKKSVEASKDADMLNQSALVIQSAFRGYQVRKDLKKLRLESETEATNDAVKDRRKRSIGKNEIKPGTDQEKVRAATKIQSAYRGHRVRKTLKKKDDLAVNFQAKRTNNFEVTIEHETDKEKVRAATKIQSAYRGHRVRRTLKKKDDFAVPFQAKRINNFEDKVENVSSSSREDKSFANSPSKSSFGNISEKSHIPVAVIHPTKYSSNPMEASVSAKVSETKITKSKNTTSTENKSAVTSPVKQSKTKTTTTSGKSLKNGHRNAKSMNSPQKEASLTHQKPLEKKSSVKSDSSNENSPNKEDPSLSQKNYAGKNGKTFISDNTLDQTLVLGSKKLTTITSSGYGPKSKNLKTKTLSTADLIDQPLGSKNVRDQFARKGKSVSTNGRFQKQETFDLEAIKKELLSQKIKTPPQSGTRKKTTTGVRGGKQSSPKKLPKGSRIPQKSPNKPDRTQNEVIELETSTTSIQNTDGSLKEEKDFSKTFNVHSDHENNLNITEPSNGISGSEDAKFASTSPKKTLNKTFTVRSSLNEIGGISSQSKTRTEEVPGSLKDVDGTIEKSAVTIQKTFRGYRTRKNLRNKRLQRGFHSDTGNTSKIDNINGNSVTQINNSSPKKDISKTEDTVFKVSSKENKRSEINKLIEEKEHKSFTNEAMLQDPAFDIAATKIQKTFRGHRTRKNFKNTRPDKNESILAPGQNSEVGGEKGTESSKSQNIPMKDARTDNLSIEEPKNLDLDKAALTIQKTFRGHRTRKNFKNTRPDQNENILAPAQNSEVKGEKGTETSKSQNILIKDARIDDISSEELKLLDLDKAATKIQKTFRGHRTRKNFKNTRPDKNESILAPAQNSEVKNEKGRETSKSQNVLIKDARTDDLSSEELKLLDLDKAATKIQKTFRGHRTRKNFKNTRPDQNENILAPAQNSEVKGEKGTESSKSQNIPMKDARTDNLSIEEPKNLDLDKAAITIQKTFRGYQSRKHLQSKKTGEAIKTEMESSLKTPDQSDLIKGNAEIKLQKDPEDLSLTLDKKRSEDSLSIFESLKKSFEDYKSSVLDNSATTIQKNFRGYRARKDIRKKRNPESTRSGIAKDTEELDMKAKESLGHLKNNSKQNVTKSEEERKELNENGTEGSEESATITPKKRKNNETSDFEKSATTIQKTFRGYQTRKNLKEQRMESVRENINERKKDDKVTEKSTKKRLRNTEPVEDRTVLEEKGKDTPSQKQGIFDSFDVEEFQNVALQNSATTIQKTFRGYKARKELLSNKNPSITAEDRQSNNERTAQGTLSKATRSENLHSILESNEGQTITSSLNKEASTAPSTEQTEEEEKFLQTTTTGNQSLAQEPTKDHTSTGTINTSEELQNSSHVGLVQEVLEGSNHGSNAQNETVKTSSAGAILENAASTIQKAYRSYHTRKNNKISNSPLKSYSHGTQREISPKEVLENSDESSIFIGPDTSFDLSDVDSVETKSEKTFNYDKLSSSEAHTPINNSEEGLASTYNINIHSEEQGKETEGTNTPQKLRRRRSIMEPTAPPLEEILTADELVVISPKSKWFVGDEPIIPSDSSSSKPSSPSSVNPLVSSSSSKFDDLSSVDACRENLNSNQQLTPSIKSAVVSTSSLLLTNITEMHDNNTLNKNSGIVSANEEEILGKEEKIYRSEENKLENEDKVIDLESSKVVEEFPKDAESKETEGESKNTKEDEFGDNTEIVTDLCKNCAEGIHEGGICSENLIKSKRDNETGFEDVDPTKHFVNFEEVNQDQSPRGNTESSVILASKGEMTVSSLEDENKLLDVDENKMDPDNRGPQNAVPTEESKTSKDCPAISLIPPSSEDDTSEREVSLETVKPEVNKEKTSKNEDNDKTKMDINESKSEEAKEEATHKTEVKADSDLVGNVDNKVYEDVPAETSNSDLKQDLKEDTTRSYSTEDKSLKLQQTADVNENSNEKVFESQVAEAVENSSIDRKTLIKFSSNKTGEKDSYASTLAGPIEDAFKTLPGEELKIKDQGFEDDFSEGTNIETNNSKNQALTELKDELKLAYEEKIKDLEKNEESNQENQTEEEKPADLDLDKKEELLKHDSKEEKLVADSQDLESKHSSEESMPKETISKASLQDKTAGVIQDDQSSIVSEPKDHATKYSNLDLSSATPASKLSDNIDTNPSLESSKEMEDAIKIKPITQNSIIEDQLQDLNIGHGISSSTEDEPLPKAAVDVFKSKSSKEETNFSQNSTNLNSECKDEKFDIHRLIKESDKENSTLEDIGIAVELIKNSLSDPQATSLESERIAESKPSPQDQQLSSNEQDIFGSHHLSKENTTENTHPENLEIAAELIRSASSDPKATSIENENKVETKTSPEDELDENDISNITKEQHPEDKNLSDTHVEAKLEKLIEDNLKPVESSTNTIDSKDLPTENSSQEVIEEPCVKKVLTPTPYSASSDPDESELESTTTKAESTTTTPGYDDASETDALDIPASKPDVLEAITEKHRETEAMVARMHQRRASEHKISIDSVTDQPIAFEESICQPIKPMQKIQKSSSTEAEDEYVLQKLQRGDTTRESSAQSESVVFGDSTSQLTESEDTFNENMDIHSLHRMNTTAANRSTFKPPSQLIKSVTIDDTVKYIDPEKSTEESGSSFCMDDALSEDVRKKMMAYSISEADSDYFDVGDQSSHLHDDFNISTALDNFPSTDTDTTIVSAATKIQAGARGFLTRRRIRRASMGTKASLTEDQKMSFGNDAIGESLDQLAEEEVGRRQFNRQTGVNSLPSALEHSDETNHSRSSLLGEDIQTETITSTKHSSINIKRKKANASTTSQNDGNVVGDVNNGLEKPENESTQAVSKLETTVARRLTLQRGDALRNDSTPDDENGNGKQVALAKNIPSDIGTLITHEKTMVESTTTTTTRTTTERRNYSDAAVSTKKEKIKWFAMRQNSMPVQIDSEVFRVLPKHMRKRIKSAEGEKPKRIRLPRD